MQRFSASQLADYLQHQQPRLIDVREPWEFDICHIEGSELVPMRQIPEQLDELDRNEETVLICHHGVRSLQVAIYLERMGFEKLINLDGGVAYWAMMVDQTMPTY